MADIEELQKVNTELNRIIAAQREEHKKLFDQYRAEIHEISTRVNSAESRASRAIADFSRSEDERKKLLAVVCLVAENINSGGCCS